MDCTAKCPFCSKTTGGAEPGEHRCSRCSGVFRVSSSGETSKIRRSCVWLAVTNVGMAVTIVAGIAVALTVWLAPDSPAGMHILFPLFAVAFSLTFISGILHALRTGELPLGKGATYKEDGVPGFYFCLFIAAVAAIVSLAAAIKLALEGFGK